MATRKRAVVQIDDELFELETASTSEVTLIHRVTGKRRIVGHHELAELVARPQRREPQQLDTLPKHVINAALALAVDIEEVITGVGRNGKCRPRYDLATTSQETRISRKLEDLEFDGRGMVRSNFFLKMKSYQRDGIIGLVDGRALRQYKSRVEAVDWRILDALLTVINAQTNRSTGTASRVIAQLEEAVRKKYGNLRLPCRTRLYALIDDLGGPKHTTKSGKTRRSLGNRPDRPFAKQEPMLPGAYVQVDSNTMDIEVRVGDKRTRPRLTILTDVYSRSIIAYTIRLDATKAVDHAMLLTQSLSPRQNRPSRAVWRDAVRRKHPGLTLLDENEYSDYVRAIPFIHPRQWTTDRGADYTGKTLREAMTRVGMSAVLSAPYTPTSKPHVERQFKSINTMFTQHLDGYIGRSPEHRGKDVPLESLLSVEALRELFEDWVVSVWQVRKHSELRDNVHPTEMLSPNEKAARAALTVEQLHIALSCEDYIRMLDSEPRTIQSTGVRINNRMYDSELLHPLKGMKSRNPRLGGKWEVKVDPYNPTYVWVVGREGELIECAERGAEARTYLPDFAPVDDHRSLTAKSEAELLGQPTLAPYSPPPLDYTADSDLDDDDDDYLYPDLDD
jgi:transposase InsO family protein